MRDSQIVISPKSIIFFFALIFLIWIIVLIKEVLLFLFASFIIASALYPLVNFLSKKMPRTIAVSLIFIVGFIIILTVLVPVTLISLEQTNQFI